jgi:hypothetical protein
MRLLIGQKQHRTFNFSFLFLKTKKKKNQLSK